jgi:hypothetical protein
MSAGLQWRPKISAVRCGLLCARSQLVISAPSPAKKGALDTAKLGPAPLPPRCQNSGGIRRIVVNSRELTRGNKASGFKLLEPEVARHQ